MYNHLMIDLETLSENPGAIVTSIGAAFFNPNEDYTDDIPNIPLFYKNIDIDSSKKLGLEFNARTLFWWMEQGQDAIKALTDPTPVNVKDVVSDFINWFWIHKKSMPKDTEVYIWSHGATFDIPYWGDVIVRCEKKIPWKYSNARDTRTLFDITKCETHKFEGFGTKHNAIHDALTQIIWVQEAFKKVKK